MTRRNERRPSRRGVLLGLLPLAVLLAVLWPAPAQADPLTDEFCTFQLTGEEGGTSPAELTVECTEEFGGFVKVIITGTADKDFLAAGLVPDGFACLPPGPRDATCKTLQGTDAATFTILAQDACGTEDDVPLVFSVTAEGEGTEPPQESVRELQIQCEEPPGNGDGDGDGNGDDVSDDGGGGVLGGGDDPGDDAGEDAGQVPQGGVQSGAGGTAPADGAGGLLAALAGLILAATIGLGIARARS